MALVGTFKLIEQIPSETETQKVTVTFPNNIPEDDPYFEKAGKTEEIEQPVINEVVTEYKNAYLNVKANSVHKDYFNERNLLSITYEVFKSKEDRNNGKEAIFQKYLVSIPIDISKEFPIVKSYEIISGLKETSEMIKD